ncbi:hypothetical protein J5N97_028979 [Dioscorea zingiberensis]|uniref:RING-type E3 ubiquitin transferase n=1 Tax=Dioscorea zingiberensis TaxID=325984 RepID=A0A9D5H5G7_9LILI|nr:hypothetical protein J5N97_028979 [Dioscorea zingiberensis]
MPIVDVCTPFDSLWFLAWPTIAVFNPFTIDKECRDRGRRPSCPLTRRELNTTDLNPSIAIRNTIEEWTKRNEAARLDICCRSITPASSESTVFQALEHVISFCQKSRPNKQVVRNLGLIPQIAEMLKNSSSKVRCKALETLRIVAEEDIENKEAMAAGDTIRTIVKLLSHDGSQEREEAVSLLCELSESENLCEKIGGVSEDT